MFSCRIAGLRNLLTICSEAEQTSPRPEKDVCRLAMCSETEQTSPRPEKDVCRLAKHREEWIPFRVGRFGFGLSL